MCTETHRVIETDTKVICVLNLCLFVNFNPYSSEKQLPRIPPLKLNYICYWLYLLRFKFQISIQISRDCIRRLYCFPAFVWWLVSSLAKLQIQIFIVSGYTWTTNGKNPVLWSTMKRWAWWRHKLWGWRKKKCAECQTDFTSCERKSTLENNGFKLNNEWCNIQWNSSLFIYCIYCDTRNTILWLSVNVCHVLWFRLHDTHDHQEVLFFIGLNNEAEEQKENINHFSFQYTPLQHKSNTLC